MKEKYWDEIIDLFGSNDVPATHRLFRNAKSLSWSLKKLLCRSREALAGTYHPKKFSQTEIDLATAIYELGSK